MNRRNRKELASLSDRGDDQGPNHRGEATDVTEQRTKPDPSGSMAANPLIRAFLRAIQLGADLASVASCHLVRWTGKSTQAIHPKHLLPDALPAWYVPLVRPGDCVLDLGTGVGAHAVRCARAGAQVIAADLNEKNLAKAKSFVAGEKFLYGQDARATVRLMRCDATKGLPFQSEIFTGALLLDVLEHLPDPVATLRECVRVLRPGAWLAMALPNSQTKWKQRYRRAGLFWMSDRDHKHEYTWPEIVDLLRSVGLRVQSGPEPIVLDTPWTGLIDLVGGISLRLYRRLIAWRATVLARSPQDTTGFRCVAIRP